MLQHEFHKVYNYYYDVTIMLGRMDTRTLKYHSFSSRHCIIHKYFISEKDCFGQSCTVVIVVVVVIVIVVLALLAACVLCLALFIRKKKRRWRRRKRNRVGVAVESDDHELIEADPETHMFTTKHTYSVQ